MTNWERRPAELLKERDECLELATRNRIAADRYREALEKAHAIICAHKRGALTAAHDVIGKALFPKPKG